jgi:DNA-binding NarL/FixJ family response regulator
VASSAVVRQPAQALKPVTVVIADDESIFRTSLRHLLGAPPTVIRDVYGVDVGPGFSVVGEAGTGEETIAVVRRVAPELLILDLTMPRLTGLDVIRELQAGGHLPWTVMLAGIVEKPHLRAAVQSGVSAVMLKDATTERLFEAIMVVLAGQRWLDKSLIGDLMEVVGTSISSPGTITLQKPHGLTPRERQVLAHVVAGDGNKEIARKCAVSEETIKHHLTRIFDKVGASNRLELALVATQAGLVSDAPRGN